jgi:hypothetical protein
MFRSRILPAIIAVWGALVALNVFLTGTEGGAYGAGQLAAGVIGVVMVAAGIRALRRA